MNLARNLNSVTSSSIRVLDVSCNALNRVRESFLHFIKFLSKVEDINLASTGIYADDIGEIIKYQTTLTALDISDNDLNDTGVMLLSGFLSPAKLKRISMNRIWGRATTQRTIALKVLAEAINHSHIEELQLQGGAKYNLRQGLMHFVSFFRENKNIKKLDISGHQDLNYPVYYLVLFKLNTSVVYSGMVMKQILVHLKPLNQHYLGLL